MKSATTDPAIIRGWWTKWPDANVAIATGAASGLVVVDEDPDHGGSESLHDLEQRHGNLPPAPENSTGGGGVHYLFAHSGIPLKNSTGKLRPGLDVRGDGGYAILPPSRHISGGVYEWDLQYSPDRVAPPPIPAWLLELVMGKKERDGHHPADLIPEVITEGERNTTLASLAGSMRRRGAGEASILAALEAENSRIASDSKRPVSEPEPDSR